MKPKYYNCPKCAGTHMVTNFWRWLLAPKLFDIWRWNKCPWCGKYSWMRRSK